MRDEASLPLTWDTNSAISDTMHRVVDPPPELPPPPLGPQAVSAAHRWRWLTLGSLGIALIAAGVAAGVTIGAWRLPFSRDMRSSVPTYSAQQTADAKTKICTAFQTVSHAVTMNNSKNLGDEPMRVLAVANSARQTLDFGSIYLRVKLGEEPAASSDLVIRVRKLANSYEELTLGYLDGLTNADAALKPVLDAIDDATSRIEQLCI